MLTVIESVLEIGEQGVEDLEQVPEFAPFTKIPRLSREITVSEKIDGTNGVIWISDTGQTIKAGSRNRWLEPGKSDNFGFATWVEAHKSELLEGLDPGRHYGEWWGPGIQRGYGLAEKKFSLFNTHRWGGEVVKPACVDVVPVLYTGVFSTDMIESVLRDLACDGSKASPGFMRPEGIVIFHAASGHLYKKTILDDEKPKGSTE